MEVSNTSVSPRPPVGMVCPARRNRGWGFRWMLRLPALALDIPLAHFSPRMTAAQRQTIMDTLLPGDILLTSDKLFPVWQLVVSLLGSPRFSHAAIYEGSGRVVEATTFHPSGQGVARTAVDEFLSGRKTVCVLRPTYASEYRKLLMLAYLERQLGKPYDYSFRPEDSDTMYCAKLVAKALHAAGFTVLTRRLGKREFYLPDTFIRTAGLTMVYGASGSGPAGRTERFPLAFTVSVLAGGFLIDPLSLSVFGLLWIAAGWLQHLKIL